MRILLGTLIFVVAAGWIVLYMYNNWEPDDEENRKSWREALRRRK